MPDQQPTQPPNSRFQTLCGEVEDYDHLPVAQIDQRRPAPMLTGPDQEADLDAEILAGLVSP
ncbi:MAG: hypothetical protein ACRDKL_12170 [Solirubrobacteraceae bacterium]